MNWITISIPYPSVELITGFWTFYFCLGSCVMMIISFVGAWISGGKADFTESCSFKEQFFTILSLFFFWPMFAWFFTRHLQKEKSRKKAVGNVEG